MERYFYIFALGICTVVLIMLITRIVAREWYETKIKVEEKYERLTNNNQSR